MNTRKSFHYTGYISFPIAPHGIAPQAAAHLRAIFVIGCDRFDAALVIVIRLIERVDLPTSVERA